MTVRDLLESSPARAGVGSASRLHGAATSARPARRPGDGVSDIDRKERTQRMATSHFRLWCGARSAPLRSWISARGDDGVLPAPILIGSFFGYIFGGVSDDKPPSEDRRGGGRSGQCGRGPKRLVAGATGGRGAGRGRPVPRRGSRMVRRRQGDGGGGASARFHGPAPERRFSAAATNLRSPVALRPARTDRRGANGARRPDAARHGSGEPENDERGGSARGWPRCPARNGSIPGHENVGPKPPLRRMLEVWGTGTGGRAPIHRRRATGGFSMPYTVSQEAVNGAPGSEVQQHGALLCGDVRAVHPIHGDRCRDGGADQRRSGLWSGCKRRRFRATRLSAARATSAGDDRAW